MTGYVGALSDAAQALVLSALVLVCLMMGVAAGVLTRLRRVGREEEVAEMWSAPVLARLPGSSTRPLRLLRPSRSPSAAEDLAYRRLALNLALEPGRPRCVLVTSAMNDDAKTSVVAGLALRLASERQPVVAIDLDVLDPSLAPALRVPTEPNLATVLAPGARLADVASNVRGSRFLRVVPGVRDARISTLATLRERLPELIGEARAGSTHVILQTASLEEGPDALTLIEEVDDVVIVAREDATSASALEAWHELVTLPGSPLAGLVLVGGTPRLGAGTSGAQPAVTETPEAPPPVAAEPLELVAGDRVQWNRGNQRDIGIVERTLTAPTTVGGRRFHASENEPRYLVRNVRSGKQAVHKAGALTKVREQPPPSGK
jgi:Mrp family chromosome partitioning ATPase